MFEALAVTNWCDFPVSPDILQIDYKWLFKYLTIKVAIQGVVKEVE
jgi:hypothetical protein